MHFLSEKVQFNASLLIIIITKVHKLNVCLFVCFFCYTRVFNSVFLSFFINFLNEVPRLKSGGYTEFA